jgi:two-component system cell cycle sensor histidine kinase/response regulator CckA
LQQILEAAERAANLTRSLLAFSRKQAIRPRTVNLNKIVENVEKLLLRLIGENIDLRVELMGTELNVMADSGQIEQILMNLATNAKDAMPRGGSLTIRTDQPVLDNEFIRQHGYGTQGTYARISVSDTGVGIDERTRSRIFEPFFTTKDIGKGTGLGLSIVYGIVKQHNGYITCDSFPDKGTTFNIYLPIIKGEAENSASADQPPLQRGTETILIAEDDVTVRTLLKKMLEQFGYAVIEAVDGEDAVDKFRKNRKKVRLLILDVIMPKRNGKEVYDLLRKDTPGVKAIFSSGYMSDILHQEGMMEEGLVFIPKPVTANELLRTVRTTLDQG